MRDPLGAFCEFHDVQIDGRAGGPLSGLTFGLKDVFDLAGERVGAGNPDFLRDQKPASRTAAAVQALLDAGASLIGKTIADELCFSLEGENAHYGTPVNPNAMPFVPRRFLIASDALALADADVVAALKPVIDRLAARFGAAQTVTVCAEGIDAWVACLRVIQGIEIAGAHGAWVATAKPQFEPRIAERFAWAVSIDPALLPGARAMRQRYVAAMDALLGDDALLCLPTTPGIAPLRNTPPADLHPFRMRALQMLGISGVAGTPQVSLPAARVNGCPVGLSLIGPRGSDLALLALAANVALTP